MRTILHVDLDAFFAAVEQRDRPELRGKPVVVGGASRRGVVAAASYEARVFGVRSAMPMVEALRRCPHAVVVPPRRGPYEAASRAVFAIFARYTPLVEGLSIDEAFLDVTGSRALFGEGEEIARRIKADVRAETRLVASAGVATSKFVAKIASDFGKPDGLCAVAPGDERRFLAPLPIERMWGVGPKTAPELRRLGLATFRQLAEADPAWLARVLGPWAATVRRLAIGDDERAVEPTDEARSIGAEETFEHDLGDVASIERTLLTHAERVADRLVRAGLEGQVVRVKLKYADFSLRSRQTRLPEPASDTSTLYAAARALLMRFAPTRLGVRLTGLAVADLTARSAPQTLFPDPRLAKRRALEDVVVGLRSRHGGGTVTRAALLDAPTSTRRPPGARNPVE